ncbi:MAG: serine/threonine protein kinase [Planctomycetaceae bacterium]
MWEPPSEKLQRALASLNLCTSSDLRRCRGTARRLARDLPTFDSVWLDALVQRGRLTPFQAKCLESARPEQLSVGPCLLVERLGNGLVGETFLARPASGGELCVLKLVRPDHSTAENEARLGRLVSHLARIEHPSLALPRSCHRVGDRVALVSRYINGYPLRDLLVRRGRFPPAVVWDIGRQLADALAAAERQRAIHGDLRVTNVRLTRAGLAVLVGGGFRAVLEHSFTVHSKLPADRYDAIAPELIGSCRPPDQSSDRFALGCLLWQLLAGRPPFPGGDPLVKLVAHQTRRIDDIRKWAPDVPQALAEGIWRLTAPQVEHRPTTYAELLDVWQPPSRAGRRRLAAFHREFDSPAAPPRELRRAVGGPRFKTSFYLAAVLLVAAAGLTQFGARNVPLLWPVRPRAAINSLLDDGKPPVAKGSVEELLWESRAGEKRATLLPLPAPDATGTIRLETPGPYRAASIRAIGTMQIVGAAARPAEIVVDEPHWSISAAQVRLAGLHVRREWSNAENDPWGRSLLQIETQALEIEGCAIEAARFDFVSPQAIGTDGDENQAGAGIVWRAVEPLDSEGAELVVRNCVCASDGAALWLADRPARVEITRCLHLGTGPVLHLAATAAPQRPISIALHNSTCRNTPSVVRMTSGAGPAARGDVAIDADECVFDLRSPPAAFLELIAPRPVALKWLPRLRVSGEGSVASAEMLPVAYRARVGSAFASLDGADMVFEGIVTGGFRFASDISANPADSEVRECETPRRTPTPPGIVASELPVVASASSAEKISRSTSARR